jgi:hypothetical protein
VSSEITADLDLIAPALATAGTDERFRNSIFDALRQAEIDSDNPAQFREQIRWPLILALLSEAKTHRVVLQNGLVFEVSPDSRIEKALLLSTDAHPDHVWERETSLWAARTSAIMLPLSREQWRILALFMRSSHRLIPSIACCTT